MVADVALDRDALYYPYIHITDVNWLKATLLCFPNVRRMIPNDYSPDDSREIREFCEVIGPRGEPLLTSVNLFSPAAEAAEKDLLRKLKANDAFIRSRYSKRKTVEQYGKSANQFCLHSEKIIAGLYNHLIGRGDDDSLAWWTRDPSDRPSRAHFGHWIALHPALGGAILSVKAIAIANELGLDIVTDSSAVHHTVITRKQDDIFEELIGKPPTDQAPAPADIVDELAELVMTTNFDVSKLSAKQIGELLSDGKDLRRFKDALIPIAASIPAIRDPKEREKRLTNAAREVVEEWQKYKKSLPRFALDAIFDSAEVKWPDVAGSVILGGGTALGIAAGAGLGIAMVSYAGLKIWRKHQEQASSPYGYLNRISKAQGKNQSFLVLPPAAPPFDF